MTEDAQRTIYLMPLDSPNATLANAGGKGLNLARLVRAGFRVPGGFVATTAAYAEFVAANGLDAEIATVLAGVDCDDPAALETAAVHIRAAFERGNMAPAFAAAVDTAYAAMGAPPVAVRSSATAEDLPDLSFAGQQDTLLNIVDAASLHRAIVRCWSSLWTARAIGYRARNAIDQEQVALAVVVQAMVPAEASGVLFTANPLTGKRTETVIDATLGLGEALVSGQVEPDHYVVDTRRRTILDKTLGVKAITITGAAAGGTVTVAADAATRQAIPDAVILDLVDLGARVAAFYDAPQDIEWAWADGELHLLQARPITSLFPVPAGMPPEPLKVMMAFSAVQGIFEPLTPLGQDTMKTVLRGGGKLFGYDTGIERQRTFTIAAERIYINFTPVLSNAAGRQILPRIAGAIDPGVAQAFAELVDDPRLAPQRSGISPNALRRILGFALPMAGRVRRAWQQPAAERARVTTLMDEIVAATASRVAAKGDLWGDYALRLQVLLDARNLFPDVVIPNGVAVVVAGMIPFFGILQRFAREAARVTGDPAVALLPLEIARSLPHNVTTEMDLALWQTAQNLRHEPESAHLFATTDAAALADLYLARRLPPFAQGVIAAFMAKYGMRGLGEIDLGRPRWREQPEHIMQVLQSYLRIEDPVQAPDAVFARGKLASTAAAERLEAAVRQVPGGALKARLVRAAIVRYRALAGLREAPKFFAVRMMGLIRQGLLESGAALCDAGLLAAPDDLFFLYVRELEEIARLRTIPASLRAQIAERRALRAREMLRKQLPRVLLSDGTCYYDGVRAADGDASAIVGDPVSPGVVEGTVRVVFNPNGTQLAPGEILVCPGTDPAWTPLFLAAGGLVMEVGGMMTHGSVVAREYGIPAVVGVHEATRRLQTGDRVRVDGSSGAVTVLAKRIGNDDK